jgi:energy-coupling factor transport system ATP-binding protein
MNLKVDHVTFQYSTGVVALDDVWLEIASGESVAIIGENGAGKSTLARHLNGLLRPTKGRVLIGESNSAKISVAKLASRVGFVFQNPDEQLFERTVEAEVGFGPRNLGLPKEDIHFAVLDALKRVGLAEHAHEHPYDLHISQRRLVALAATLAMNTPIVVLDEPTTGQDAFGVSLIGGLVDALRSERRTVITVTHDIDFCAEHFPRVIVMASGKIIADGLAPTVLAQDQTLHQAEVEPPQMIRLAKRLALPEAPLTTGQFVDAWSKRRNAP